ncbi:hypothetical protein ACFO0N_17240 [Halobium salinum]|uniref:Uncharacterized protein n=1 Tax=Halobium salinum TaxID=1364940 RepID=A0ABD5PFS8_9EURY|nr:hypothetical protein [Halobium salinum]
MHTTSLAQALTLYRSGTLTLAQAATRAGRSEREFLTAMEKFGVARRPEPPTVDATAERPVGAD